MSSTYTEPLAAVAEKLGTVNANGAVIDVPTFPFVESRTSVFAVIADTDPVIELVDINAAEPLLLPVMVAFVRSIPALVPTLAELHY